MSSFKDFGEFLSWEETTQDTIDFKKIYVDMADGDPIAGIALSQIVFWHLPNKNGHSKLRVEKDGHFWIAKGRDEWWDECRLTPKRVDRALAILEAEKLIEKKLFKFDGSPTVHVRIRHEEFLLAWKGHLPPPPPEYRVAGSIQQAAPNQTEEVPAEGEMYLPQRVKTVLPAGQSFSSGELDFPNRAISISPSGQNSFSPSGELNLTPLVKSINTENTAEITNRHQQQQAVDVDENSEILAQLLTWDVHLEDAGFGVSRKAGAKRLAREVPDICLKWLKWFPDLLEQMQGQGKVIGSTGALLASCIRDAREMPALTKQRLEETRQAAEQEERAAAARKTAQIAREAQATAQNEREAREEAEAARLQTAWDSLDTEAQERLEAQARARMGVLGAAGRASAALEAMKRNLLRDQLDSEADQDHASVHLTPGHALSDSNIDGHNREAARRIG